MFYQKKRLSIKTVILVLLFFYVAYCARKNMSLSKIGGFFMSSNKLGDMPSWNLSDLYLDIDDNNIAGDLISLTKQIESFKKYDNKVANLSGEQFYNSLVEYENIQELEAKLSSYAYLKYAENLSVEDNVKFYQNMVENLTTLDSNLLFYTLEINKLSNERVNSFLYNKNVQKYKQLIDDIRVMKPHQLNEDLEKVFLEKSVTSRNSWSRLFDETIDTMKFVYGGNEYNTEQMLEFMNGSNASVRKETSKIFGETLGKNAKLFALITNTLAKDKSISDNWRKFKTPISSRNLSNLIEDEVVESLRQTIKDNYKNTAHRYYKWKAKEMKKEKLHYSDRNAPLPYDDDTLYKWEDAKQIVRDAYKDFSPEMAKIGDRFFDNNWIDVPTRQGKRGGGFMSPTTTKVHPYILLNYVGRTRDVMTLAHELGHGIHQTLSDEKNSFLLAQSPLTLAETASVFGEQLTFRKLLADAKNDKQKKAILARKIEDMLNTVVRQIAFLEFEIRIHDERKNGEIPLEKINQIWLDVQKESLGADNFEWDEEYKYYWSYIPHFIHSPFYVYSYAFGDCLVNSLYQIYLQEPNGFQEKYINLLSSGGSKRYSELLKEFNLNPKDPLFWQKGVDVLIKMIDELEKTK
ncbi:MAG: M3 family oligoendopeptidase [Rickettsiales bacterium]|nr:MAG: M3 family oligoendopeptidase [Rickettsiales bacterium]